MPEGKGKHRLESSVVVPERSSQKRATVNSESDSDSERRSKKWREKRRPSPEHKNKWERNRENRTGGNRRAERDEREESARDGDLQSRSLPRRVSDQSVTERLEQRRSNDMEFGLRYSSVMDLDPSDVPRGGRYFLHDDRESSTRTYYQRNSWGRGGRRGDTRRGNGRSERRRSRSPLWKHDKFEEIVAEGSEGKDSNEKATKSSEEDKK